MRDRRLTQQIVTGGTIAGNPAALVSGGLLASRNRFRAVPGDASKSGLAGGALDYAMVFENTVDTRSAEIVAEEYVDDLAVLGGTTTR